MAVRALVAKKTWQFNVNQILKTVGASNTNFKQLMLALVNSLLNFTTNPWTCVGSSDGSTSNLSGTNLWSGNSALVWANSNGTSHSWIVLKNLTGLGTYQILISLVGSGATGGPNWCLRASPGGNYTGGSASNDPTATDEMTIASSAAWTDTNISGGSVGVRVALHAMMSTDGQCTRIFHTTNQGMVNGILMIEKLTDSGVSAPVAILSLGGGSTQVTFGNFLTSSSNWRMLVGSVTVSGRGTAEGTSTSPLVNDSSDGTNFMSDVDETWPVTPMGLVGVTRGGIGALGTFQDLWIASSNLLLGSMLTTDKKFVSLSPLVVPWSGADMRIGG